MKKETNKTSVSKKLFMAVFLVMVLVLTGISIDTHGLGADSAYAKGRSSKPSHSPSKSSKSSSKGTPSGGKKSNNGYAKANLSGNCKKVNGYCVTFSKNNCHNFYINGRHYGGSQSCRILDTRCGGGSKKTTKSNPPPSNPPPSGGGNPPAGCPAGTYLCNGACIPLSQQCNPGNPNYNAFVPNPDIPLGEGGPVRLKNLVSVPPVGNNGYSCRIVWKEAFESYDDETHCTFLGPNVSISFDPASTTPPAPTEFTSPALTQDTVYRLICREGTDGDPLTKETVCRVNLSLKETN